MKKLVFITWWATWIWAACCKKFAKEWYWVAINYLNSSDHANELANQLWHAKAFQWDMSKQEDIDRVFSEIKDHFNQNPEILINNAAVVWRVKFPELDWNRFSEILNINAVWPYLVTRQFIQRQEWKLDWKSIVFLWSMRWWPESSSASSIDYCASKAAVHNMVVTLAKSFSPCRVNWIAPGFTKTLMHKWNLERLEKEAEKSILKRYSEPEEIAESVYFFASDLAKSITGQVLRVDNWRSLMS